MGPWVQGSPFFGGRGPHGRLRLGSLGLGQLRALLAGQRRQGPDPRSAGPKSKHLPMIGGVYVFGRILWGRFFGVLGVFFGENFGGYSLGCFRGFRPREVVSESFSAESAGAQDTLIWRATPEACKTLDYAALYYAKAAFPLGRTP